jgi:hypothetical protein
VWWYIPVIPALGKLRQEDCKLEASLYYKVRPCLKKKQREKKNHLKWLKKLVLKNHGTISI